MEKQDIPQDDKILDGKRVACYVLEDDGTYTIGKSSGWEPVNVANIQAWEDIHEKISHVSDDIEKGIKSVLAFHMEMNQMDAGLLSKYVKIPKWRVKRHLKPSVFSKLKPSLLERYAAVFQLTVDELVNPPEIRTSMDMLKKVKRIKE